MPTELYLTDPDYAKLVTTIIRRRKDSGIINDHLVRVFIDCTATRDYAVKVEGLAPRWEWTSPDYRDDIGYFRKTMTVGSLLDIIKLGH